MSEEVEEEESFATGQGGQASGGMTAGSTAEFVGRDRDPQLEKPQKRLLEVLRRQFVCGSGRRTFQKRSREQNSSEPSRARQSLPLRAWSSMRWPLRKA